MVHEDDVVAQVVRAGTEGWWLITHTEGPDTTRNSTFIFVLLSKQQSPPGGPIKWFKIKRLKNLIGNKIKNQQATKGRCTEWASDLWLIKDKLS